MSTAIVITGGAGLYGSALIEQYLKRESDTRIIALVRGKNREAAKDRLFAHIRHSPTFSPELYTELSRRVIAITGDFTQKDLGVSPAVLSDLQLSTTDIIHSGATVDFGLPLSEARVINVDGTYNMLEFALQCPKLRAFLHISTGHVAGKRAGTIMEHEIGTEQGFFNSYEQTKAESELLVHSFMDRIPVTIHRLTTIIGDYVTGYIRQFGFFHNSIRLLAQGIIPFLAGDKNGHLDLIPTEYPVQAVYHLHRNNFKPGNTYHICCGPEKSFTLEEFLNETVEYFKKKHNKASIATPAILAPDEFEKRIVASKNTRISAIMGALGTFIGHLTLPKVFDQTHTQRDMAGSTLEAPHIRSYYFKVLDECIKRNFGKK